MVIRLVKPMLEPVLKAQAERLRKTALELPEPHGPRTGQAGGGNAVLSILVAGDSSAAGVGARTQEEALAPRLAQELATRINGSVRWQLVAQTGLTSIGVLELLRRETLPVADLAIVILGVNDISNDVPLRQALLYRNRIVQTLRERCQVRRLVFPGLPEVERFPLLPQPLAWYGGALARHNNRLQARWAAHPRRSGIVSHVPMDGVMHPSIMAEDGFHPGPSLYAKVAWHIAEHIMNNAQFSSSPSTVS
jgi:lysophospholipase L1-like esterase